MMAQLGVTRIKISQVGLHFDMLKLSWKDSVASSTPNPKIENPILSLYFFMLLFLSHDLYFSTQKQRSRLTGACKTLGSKSGLISQILHSNLTCSIFSNKAISDNGLCHIPEFGSSSDLKSSSLNLHPKQDYKRLAFLSKIIIQ